MEPFNQGKTAEATQAEWYAPESFDDPIFLKQLDFAGSLREHDEVENLLFFGDGSRNRYDSEGRLIQIEHFIPTESKQVFSYDAQGVREGSGNHMVRADGPLGPLHVIREDTKQGQ